jgi:ribosomal protein S6
MGRVRSLVADHQGEVIDEDSWGMRRLAYKIGNHTQANYHLAHLQMEAEGSKALEGGLKLTDDVMRHLLIKQDGPPPPKEPDKTEETKAEAPVAQEPAPEASVTGEPKAETAEPAEEPQAEEPQAEEPQAEEPQAEEPQAEEPQAEEPKTEASE